MNKILLLGTTGTARSAITKRLLSDTDYHITLSACHARATFSDNSCISVVNGNAENIEDLKKIMPEQNVVCCAIFGETLPQTAENIVAAMSEYDTKRFIFMGAVGIYNEILNEINGEDNLENESSQVPKPSNGQHCAGKQFELYSHSFRLSERGDENDSVLSVKGELVKGYIKTIPSLTKLAVQLISDENLYSRESVSIIRDAIQQDRKK